jgi:PiT family inorganic phosphate transporter
VVVIVIVALSFDYTNGFHDSANAIATSVSTRALTPRVAVGMAAVANVLGALVSTKVARTVGGGIIDPPSGREGLIIVLSALLGAIVWNLGTWFFGLPSSSSHSLIGGLVGAALVGSNGVQWAGLVDKVIIPMVLSPMIGLALGYVFMLTLLWVFKRANATKTQRGFRQGQIVSAGTMAFGHGTGRAEDDGRHRAGPHGLRSGRRRTHPAQSSSPPRSHLVGDIPGGWRIMRTRSTDHLAQPRQRIRPRTVASGVLWTTAYPFAGVDDPRHHQLVMGVAPPVDSAVRWGWPSSLPGVDHPGRGGRGRLFWLVLHGRLSRDAPVRSTYHDQSEPLMEVGPTAGRLRITVF